MNSDIRIQTTFKGNRKRRRLSNLLQCEATGYLIDLWITIAQERPSGTLTNWDSQDVALAAGWVGDADQFVDALVQSKLLDVNGDGIYHTHDWEDNQPWISGTSDRKESARKAGIASAVSRWGKTRETENNGKVTENNDPLQTVDKPCNGKVTAGQRKGNSVPYRTSTVPVPKIDVGESGVVEEPQPTPKKLKLSDSEWLLSLRESDAYKGMDIDRLYGKMKHWCEVNNKKPTRKRFVNWLNREDIPLNGGNVEKELPAYTGR